MRHRSAIYDKKARAVRVELLQGIGCTVAKLLTPPQARQLVADIEAALACCAEETETKPRDLPKPHALEHIAECEPAGTRDR